MHCEKVKCDKKNAGRFACCTRGTTLNGFGKIVAEHNKNFLSTFYLLVYSQFWYRGWYKLEYLPSTLESGIGYFGLEIMLYQRF